MEEMALCKMFQDKTWTTKKSQWEEWKDRRKNKDGESYKEKAPIKLPQPEAAF